ncbi:energy-coupling factor ABC transporter ATP-binding protein [Candidatus Desulforudis audaxviator]|uniref:ABC transporter ATP-binding protein n=1 Tax=Desulforudis audaxviator (strain MP104C) TaxID=477974 RepID=B1I144_DESAP|nr:ATP-binding cassette domain-containing protein [Candidatus Desulforudis audaxviator]ACA58836.1 cobalt ABC transporter, ATPase subunit [Candidatus Desulforudis audaxviator MP104C]AZK58849.1 cobalt ABC transporter, ATPase subunit [Candidatus Desulforudis audaxviator]
MNAFEVADLYYTYPDGTPALQGVSLEAPAGSRTALLGANGSGKSTLLLHLNGLLSARRGSVRVFGREVGPDNLREIRRRVGLVFQNPDDQLFSTSVAEDVAFGPRNLGLNPGEVRRRVMWALDTVGITALARRPPHHLSLGQKKRAAIAGVLAMEPDLLVLDEPTAGLDPSGVRQLMELLAVFHAQGRTIVLATHDVDLAYAWADRVAVLADGRLAAAGPAALLEDEDLILSADLELPVLLRVFRNTGVKPRDPVEANAWIRRHCRTYVD